MAEGHPIEPDFQADAMPAGVELGLGRQEQHVHPWVRGKTFASSSLIGIKARAELVLIHGRHRSGPPDQRAPSQRFAAT
jgi:hypothetical protein